MIIPGKKICLDCSYTVRYNCRLMDNRETLRTCALELFAQFGYDAVGVQSIVERAGVTKPTLYHYFGSKQGLLEALLEGYYRQFTGRLQEAGNYQGDLIKTLEDLARAYFVFATENQVFYRMQLSMWFAPAQSEAHQAVAEANQKQQELIEGIFSQAVEQHGNMRGRQTSLAATFLGMINTYIGLFLNGHTELDDELIYTSVHQFMHGILS